MAQLVLVRGHPGSGKSTFAAALARRIDARHFENDDFFVGEDGIYRFDPARHLDAKSECLRRTRDALDAGERVVVAATFTTLIELQPYKDIGVPLYVVEMGMNYPNIHDVPASVVEAKRQAFEPYSGRALRIDDPRAVDTALGIFVEFERPSLTMA